MAEHKRNAPCWCGSRLKYKKCHYVRDSQPKESPWKSVDSMKKSFTQKKCFAKDIGAGVCGGGVIKAHTVSRGANLIKIAKDGKVVKYDADIPSMNNNGGKLVTKLIGARDASVFHGFCSTHDRNLFSCLENKGFIGDAEQLHALAYRTLSRELYTKEASLPLADILRGADKGRDLLSQVLIQSTLKYMSTGNELSRKEIGTTHEKVQKSYINRENNVLRSLLLKFDEVIPFMMAGAWSPIFDINDEMIQNGYSHECLEQIIVSSFCNDDVSYIVLSWVNIENAPGKIIADQILALPSHMQASACLQLSVKHIENIFYAPDWFDSIGKKERELLDRLSASGADFGGNVPREKLDYETTFSFPEPSEIRSE